MILSKQILPDLHSANVELPSLSHFDLPEKVLQFGTGVLLRGLPDYFIDQANKHHKFNGRIVVVKSTSKGDLSSFKNQDNLYTICVRGIEDGGVVEK
ncbi:MAG: altronate oxidoreductase, partial [Pedobacter sp.]